MKKYILLFVLILCTVLSSCTASVPKGYEAENVDGVEVFYQRYSMSEPHKWNEENFWLSQEQKDIIYDELSKLDFKKTDEEPSHYANYTSLDQIVLLFWNNEHEGLYYYFSNGKVICREHATNKTYIAEDSEAIVSTLRNWTTEHFPELNEGDF